VAADNAHAAAPNATFGLQSYKLFFIPAHKSAKIVPNGQFCAFAKGFRDVAQCALRRLSRGLSAPSRAQSSASLYINKV